MKDLGPKPSWHSEESWQIERLDWQNDSTAFNRLVAFASGRIDAELRERGHSLNGLLSEDELRAVVKKGAEGYEPRHEVIGLAIHITLWLRAVASLRLKGDSIDDAAEA
jgi:hypothetical protein